MVPKHVKNIAKYVVLLHSSNLSQLSPEESLSVVSQGTASSQATSTLGTWCDPAEACGQLPTDFTKPWCCQGCWERVWGRQPGCITAVVLSHPWPAHVPSVTAPWAPLQCSLNGSGCTEMLWEHCVFKGTWNFSIPKSHEVAAFPVLGLVPLCLAELNFCPAHAGMMLQQWRHDA